MEIYPVFAEIFLDQLIDWSTNTETPRATITYLEETN